MAYNSDNEVREELASIQKNNRGEFIKVSKVTNKNSGNTNIDIRLWYTDDNDELKPTSKGVRFSTEVAQDIAIGIAKGMEIVDIEDLSDKLSMISDEALNSDEDSSEEVTGETSDTPEA